MNQKAPGKGVARRLLGRAVLFAATLGCLTLGAQALSGRSAPYPDAAQKAEIDRLIVIYSKRYNVPVALARRVVQSESEYRPLARNGPYWGLMQIRYDTAQGMGYRGPANGLLDAETNLAYGMAYLSNAVRAAEGNISKGHMLYRKGYYYEAKRKRLLDEMILVRDFKPVGAEATALAMADVEAATGALWSGDTASAAIAAAIAPMPRPKPGEILAPVVATPQVVQASAAGAPAGPAVAKPTVIYASVLPLSRGPSFTAPAATAPALLAAATDEGGLSPVADPTAPIPRARPVLATDAASAEAAPVMAEAAPQSVAEAVDVPVPRPRPDAAIAGSVPVAIAAVAASPAQAAAAAPVVLAQHVAMPVPRARPMAVSAD